MIARPQQREPVNGTISIVVLGFDRRDSQMNRFTSVHCDDGILLPADFEAAVVIGDHVDHALVGLLSRSNSRRNREYAREHRRRDLCTTANS